MQGYSDDGHALNSKRARLVVPRPTARWRAELLRNEPVAQSGSPSSDYGNHTGSVHLEIGKLAVAGGRNGCFSKARLSFGDQRDGNPSPWSSALREERASIAIRVM